MHCNPSKEKTSWRRDPIKRPAFYSFLLFYLSSFQQRELVPFFEIRQAFLLLAHRNYILPKSFTPTINKISLFGNRNCQSLQKNPIKRQCFLSFQLSTTRTGHLNPCFSKYHPYRVRHSWVESGFFERFLNICHRICPRVVAWLFRACKHQENPASSLGLSKEVVLVIKVNTMSWDPLKPPNWHQGT